MLIKSSRFNSLLRYFSKNIRRHTKKSRPKQQERKRLQLQSKFNKIKQQYQLNEINDLDIQKSMHETLSLLDNNFVDNDSNHNQNQKKKKKNTKKNIISIQDNILSNMNNKLNNLVEYNKNNTKMVSKYQKSLKDYQYVNKMNKIYYKKKKISDY